MLKISFKKYKQIKKWEYFLNELQLKYYFLLFDNVTILNYKTFKS